MVAVILGVDPGSRRTGFGLLEEKHGDWVHLDHGVIEVPAQADFAHRLHLIYQGLREVFLRYQPRATVVEKIFLGKNADSAFKLGHMRGLALQLAWAQQSEIFEYAPRSVKKVITGSGAADKEQVQRLVCHILRLPQPMSQDASDALALALSHSRWVENGQRLKAMGVDL